MHHEYYDPADFHGQARRVLPFDTSQGLPAISGYILQRAPAQSLFIADINRRLTMGAGALADLGAWGAGWLAAYNARTGSAFTPSNRRGRLWTGGGP